MSNFVKFELRSMTLKIERVFEKTNNFESKTGQKGHKFSKEKGLQPMQKYFFIRLNHYILSTTYVWQLLAMLAIFPMV